ncbi:hypothetical protein O181_122027 [Austropuccinia psidii MF-1]|uniref:Uncharacterized protein n=1 Tax=Austropuccinia psidii MF-1 TaxID=1389203 RepID=A0A9Q3KK17_9BASI|nr:hypothetical protein [Austropuccinia psidii MF-1]
MASWPYPAFIGVIGQFSTSPTARPLSLVLRLWGLLSLPGAYGPSSHHQGPWTNPLYYGGFGLNGLFGPFRPPTASMAHGLRSMIPLGPFWPKSNEAKKGQGGSSSSPKVRWVQNHTWDHLSQFWPQNPTNPEMAKTP